MKVVTRMALCVLAGSLVLAVLAALVVPYLGGPALFDRETVRLCRHLFSEMQRGEAISVRDRQMQRCLEGRLEVVQDLVEHDLHLTEAIYRFRQLNGLMNDGQDSVLGSYRSNRDGDDDAAIYRHIVRWVRMALRDQPDHADSLLRRLEQELTRLQVAEKSAL